MEKQIENKQDRDLSDGGLQRIKVLALCKERKISVRKLESDLNLSNGYIAKIKTGYPYKLLTELASYFGVTVEDIAGKQEVESEECKKLNTIQQAFNERPILLSLFQIAKDAPDEDIEYVIKKLEALR